MVDDVKDVLRHLHWRWVPALLVMVTGAWIAGRLIVALVVVLGGATVGLFVELRARQARAATRHDSHGSTRDEPD